MLYPSITHSGITSSTASTRKLKFKTSVLAVALAVLGCSAQAQPVSVSGTVESQEGITKLNLDSGDLTLEWTGAAFNVKETGSVQLTGNGNNSLTLTANKNQGTGYGFRFDYVTGSLTFDKFKDLTLSSEKASVDSLILANGTNSFGSTENALESLTFENLSLSAWKGEQNKLNIYSQNLSFTADQNIGKNMEVTIHKVNTGEGGKQVSNFQQVFVNGGKFTVYGDTLTFENGLVANTSSGGDNSTIILGSNDSSVGDVTIKNNFGVGTGSSMTILSTGDVLIEKEGNVTNSGTLNVKAGSITIDGNADGEFINQGKTELNATTGHLTSKQKVRVSNGTFNAFGSALTFENGLDTTGTSTVGLGSQASRAGDIIIKNNFGVSSQSTVSMISSGDVSIQKDRIINYGSLDIDANSMTIAGGLQNQGQATLRATDAINLTKGTSWVGSLYVNENATTEIEAAKLTADGSVSTLGSTTIKATETEILTGNSQAISVNGENASLTFAKTDSELPQSLTISSTTNAALVTLGTLAVESDELTINGTVQTNGGTINFGTQDQALASVHLIGTEKSTLRSNGGNINVVAQDITIDKTDGYAIASFALQRPLDGNNKQGNIVINALNNLEINGDISVGVDEAQEFNVNESSTIEISSNGTGVINGNIKTYNGAATKQDSNKDFVTTDTTSNNTAKISLKGADSALNGGIVDYTDGTVALDADHGTTFEIDGATWNNLIDSTVANVKSDGGNIVTNGNKVAMNQLANGEAGTTITTNSTKADQITIGKMTGAGLSVVLPSEVTDTLTGDSATDTQTLASIVSIEDSDSGYDIVAQEGALVGATQIAVNAEGQLTVSETVNTVTEGIQDIAGINVLTFRSHMNDLQKRMGDLRTMPKESGAWVRYYGGQQKYSKGGMKNDYNTIQIGSDYRINDNFYVGATFSYTDDDGKLKNGTSEGKQYSFGLYGGWMADNGQFVDVIVKRHRINTEFDLHNTSGIAQAGDYYNWGNSVSVEYGWRLNCPATNFWVEPQAEISYGRVDSVKYRTSAGVEVKQDAVSSLVGRLGVAVGYTFPDNKGSAYFKASALHDWDSEADTEMTYKSQKRSYTDDLGGTWGEFALGATYNATNNFTAYGEVQTTTGTPLRNPWQVSVGVRYTF